MNDASALLAALDRDLPDIPKTWPGGWPGEIEACLIDAVLSIRARYGRPDTGVRARITRYRDARGTNKCDDLGALAALGSNGLHALLATDQKVSGRLKSDLIVEAAQNLVAAGVGRSSDVLTEPQDRTAMRTAYERVYGLGPVTFEYFLMLLGKPGIKADTHIRRYVANALGESAVSSDRARELLSSAAKQRGVAMTQLDHAVWNFQRGKH
jgi:hypothetical protein